MKDESSLEFMIAFTHLVFGVAVGKLLDLRIGTVMIFAVLPDIDRLFTFAYPVIRNGIAHSLFAILILASTAYLVSGRGSTAYSCFTGYLSHLSLDLLCINGITLLYPASGFYSAGLFAETGFLPNFAVLSVSLLAVSFETRFETPRRPKVFS